MTQTLRMAYFIGPHRYLLCKVLMRKTFASHLCVTKYYIHWYFDLSTHRTGANKKVLEAPRTKDYLSSINLITPFIKTEQFLCFGKMTSFLSMSPKKKKKRENRSLQWKTNEVEKYVSENDQLQCLRIAFFFAFFCKTKSVDITRMRR